MNETQGYVQMMIESLRKKDAVLSKIIEKNEAQAACIGEEGYDGANWDQFNVLLAEKDTLIEKVNELDNGFQSLYDRIRDELNANKDQYKSEIAQMQSLITTLTDKGTRIMTMEERNRAKLERVLMGAKKEIKQTRKSMQVVSSYYKSMSNPSGDTTGYFDKTSK